MVSHLKREGPSGLLVTIGVDKQQAGVQGKGGVAGDRFPAGFTPLTLLGIPVSYNSLVVGVREGHI